MIKWLDMTLKIWEYLSGKKGCLIMATKNIDIVETEMLEMFQFKNNFVKSVNTLKGLVLGIRIDKLISSDEINELVNWCSLQIEFSHLSPFTELLPLINEIANDNSCANVVLDEIKYICNNYTDEDIENHPIKSAMQVLHGTLHGVLADNIITEQEVYNLNSWINECSFLSGMYPYDELKTLLSSILEDGIVTSEECDTLKAFCADFIDTSVSLNVSIVEISALKEKFDVKGICVEVADISFDNKSFCFTGKSSKYVRSEFKEIVEQNGAKYKAGISKDLDYLIIGSDGSSCYKFTKYGNKIESAIELRKKNGKPMIISEELFLKNCK